jgi:ABC-type nitrate/sulfonate/bicarbonate transport system permease component
MTAMQEFVVPKSMPSIFDIKSLKFAFGFYWVLLFPMETHYATRQLIPMG